MHPTSVPPTAVAVLPANIVDRDQRWIGEWLNEYRNSPNTHAVYQKEARRLLLWLHHQGLALAQLRRQHLQEYEAFLATPPADWCGPARPLGHPQWRPFSGPLAPRSIELALRSLKSLFVYLEAEGHLTRNPLAARARLRTGRSSTPRRVVRYLSRADMAILLDYLDNLPRDTPRQTEHYLRARWLLLLLYGTMIRRSETIGHAGQLRRQDDAHWLSVIGKGGKPRDVPLPPPLLEALADYRRHKGLSPWPRGGDETPLLMRIASMAPVAAKHVYLIVRTLCLGAAAHAQQRGELESAQRLRQASTHWLRHTGASHLAETVDLKVLQDNLGHASIATTGLYRHVEDRARHAATLAGFSLPSQGQDKIKE
ncbi:tyrosine-type recombinase/integrase [Chitinimonas lacunae]|uniref:Tyrosine-type recombinase/integrase n=1 Tax=Chitinimonas lacunae TaxID=1963018 RepID=A0ABV8MV28_9NEIS